MRVSAQQQKSSQQTPSSTHAQSSPLNFGQQGFEANEILRLQGMAGNQAVQRMLNGHTITPARPGIYRTPDPPVTLTGVTVNHDRVTVPPAAGLSFSATKAPSNASNVTFSLTGVGAGTSIDSSTGVITLAAGQTGGQANVQAEQTITADDGSSTTTTATAPFNLTAVPSGISGTGASAGSSSTMYGGEFTHTFSSPGGGQAALELAHVNEQFPAASGTSLNLTGPMGSLAVTVNSPDSASAGWDLDSSGQMAGPDHVTWANSFSARPFITNASNPTPSNTLPQALTATQNFRNLDYPARTYGATVASPTHRRAFEERSNQIKAVTSANGQEVVQDYAGPTVFRRIRAAPASIPAQGPTPPGGTAPAATTSQITVDTEGQAATTAYSVQPPEQGASVDSSGVLTPGTTAGTVTVRAGDGTNYDEVAVTITAPPAPAEGEATGAVPEGAAPETTPEE